MRAWPLLVLLVIAPFGAAAPLEVEAEVTQKMAKPQDAVDFPVNLTNTGDAPIRVEFAVESKPRRLVVIEPAPFVIEPGKTTRLSVVAQTPYENGQMDEIDSFTMRFTPIDPLTLERAGDAERISFSIRTQGLYVPGPSIFVALLATVGLTLASRERGAT